VIFVYTQCLSANKQKLPWNLFCVIFFTFVSLGNVSAQPLCNGVVDLSCFTNTEDPNSVRCVNGNATILSLTTGANPILLPPAQAAIIPQYVVVDGNILFNSNYTFAPGSEIVFTQDKGFFVEPGRLLSVSGSYLHGCTHLWTGITVQNGAGIRFIGNVLEDAINGIWVQGSSGNQAPSTITAHSNIFRKNATSILLGTDELSTIVKRKISLTKGGITANVFDGEGFLLPGLPGFPRPVIGIKISRTVPISIGDTGNNGVVFPVNVFKNYRSFNSADILSAKGILVQNSNVTIKNSKFESIGTFNGSQISAYGVWANGDDGMHSVRIFGLGQDGPPTFDKVSCPIASRSGSIFVYDVNSTDSHVGVQYFRQVTPLNFPPGKVVIERCNFDKYRSNAGAILIGDHEKTQLNLVRISDCVIHDNFQQVLNSSAGNQFDETEYRCGIRVFSVMPTNLGNFRIYNNEIYNDFKNQSSTYKIAAIRLSNIEGGIIHTNRLYDENSAGNVTTAAHFKGNWLNNSKSAIVYDNTIHGIQSAYQIPGRETDGISVFESGDCDIYCNDVDLLKNGISFKGENCDQTSLLQNKFNTHHNGVYLSSDAIIGVQGDLGPHENKWLSSAALLDGNFHYPGFDPTVFDDVQRVGMSKFLINNLNQNSIYWANPRTIGGQADIDYWFTDDNGQFPPAPTLSDCSSGLYTPQDPKLSEADLAVLSNNFPDYQGYPASGWEAGLRLFANVSRNAALRPSGSLAKAFYDGNSNATLGKLYTGLESVRNFGQTTTAIQVIQEEIEELLDQAYLLSDQIVYAAGETEETALLAQYHSLLEDYLLKQAEYDLLAANHQTAAQQQAATQLADLNTTTAGALWEQNLKTVLQIQLGLLATGLPLTETQQTTMQAIANQC
ncbi:MAG TPA: hypothetical protein DCF33_07615, partial [Saprospirales bacterium]|nr:hypothetical protein [Saprospirales bacterium]